MLVDHMRDCVWLEAILPRKVSFRSACRQPKLLSKLHSRVQRAVCDHKKNGIKTILRGHLYPVMPSDNQQKTLLPRFKIKAGQFDQVCFYSEVRAGTRPWRVAGDKEYGIRSNSATVNENVNDFALVCSMMAIKPDLNQHHDQ